MSIKDALAGGGGLLTGAALLLGVFMGDATRPATTVIDQVAPSSPAFNPCPDSWNYNSTDEHDHGQLRSCSLNGWVVVLDADNQAEYGLNTLNPFAEPVPPSEVPGWR